jgi:hypothetical protein
VRGVIIRSRGCAERGQYRVHIGDLLAQPRQQGDRSADPGLGALGYRRRDQDTIALGLDIDDGLVRLHRRDRVVRSETGIHRQ